MPREHADALAALLWDRLGASRVFRVASRVWSGAWNDGFIHAGNLAYLALIALFLIGHLTSGAVHSNAAALLLGGPYTAVFWVFVVGLGIVLPLAFMYPDKPGLHALLALTNGIGAWFNATMLYRGLRRQHVLHHSPGWTRTLWQVLAGNVAMVAALLLLAAIGAKSDNGTDAYISATKLYLDKSLLLNATVRFTKANQFGILGFGGDQNDDYEAQFEASAAYLLSRNLAIGAEYRTKPNNLGIADEDDAWDVFVAWAPIKNVSLTVAYVDLGNIVIRDDQRGVYASLQVGF